MLSIGAMKSGQASYYQALAKEDYYLEGGEPPGIWLGRGAERLGLTNLVEGEELIALFLGFSPDGKKLVQNAGKANRQPGWDLTFSAPKSTSVLWSQVGEQEQHEIRAAQAAAVAATISYLEKHHALSREGKGGITTINTGLVVAAFEHSCSRALDPQLHTHCLVMNLGIDDQGQARSILSKPFYQQKMLAGAYYRCELARQLQARLGVVIERPVNRDGKPAAWFEIQGVSKSILSYFSQRRAAIEKELGQRGLESASAAAFAALATRDTKTIVPPRKELHARWQAAGIQQGFSIEGLLSNSPTVTKEQAHLTIQQALEVAIDELTLGENYFTTEELLRAALEASQGLGLDAQQVADAVHAELRTNPALRMLGWQQGQTLWTTHDVLACEQEFLQSVTTLRARPVTGVSEPIVADVVAKPRGEGAFILDAEQQAAVRYLTQGQEAIKVISGFAGTGKTDMLAAAKEAWERQGFEVIGTALAGVAGRSLEAKTGIPSHTIRARERQLLPDFATRWQHHARQLGRAALGKKTWSLPKLTIDERTILVIDEAGMVGTRDFALLAKAVVQGGGTLVAVGDERQLPSIERGGCFAKLVTEIGGVRLTAIRRQTDPADQAAVRSIVDGSPEDALRHYAAKGQFYVGHSPGDAEQQLVRDWRINGGTSRPGAHRIFASTRATVERLNRLCQWERACTGLVDPSERMEHAGQVFMVGDQVRFQLSQKTRGIIKGEGGTIVACKEGLTGKYVAVALHRQAGDDSSTAWSALKHHAHQLIKAALGKPTQKWRPQSNMIVVPLESRNPLVASYRGLSLDYAMTTHLGQGQSVDNSYVLLGGKMTARELTYVQASRHREKLFLYASEQEVGRQWTELARHTRPLHEAREGKPREVSDYSALLRDMKLSRAQELAATLQPAAVPIPKQQQLLP